MTKDAPTPRTREALLTVVGEFSLLSPTASRKECVSVLTSALVKLGTELENDLSAAKAALAAKQAKIDALMLEYCPEEMTAEQLAEWGKHQVAAKDDFLTKHGGGR